MANNSMRKGDLVVLKSNPERALVLTEFMGASRGADDENSWPRLVWLDDNGGAHQLDVPLVAIAPYKKKGK